MELGHLGVYPLHPLVASHRDPVVAVLNKVSITKLVQAHRLQLHTAVERPVDPLPPLRHAPLEGHEAAVELLVAVRAATYLRDVDHRPAQIEAVAPPKGPPLIFEGGQERESGVEGKGVE